MNFNINKTYIKYYYNIYYNINIMDKLHQTIEILMNDNKVCCTLIEHLMNNFNYVLSNNNSGQINFFSLTILDQDLNLIDDIDDYFLHLQFIKMKKQSMEFLLTKLVEYVKDIFLMIGNYLYPSKVNSFMEQQIYLSPDKLFSKYKNPN